MTDIRISQLPLSSIVTAGDLLEISKNLGSISSPSYVSRKINFESIKESINGKRTVTVSKNSGADANTIKDGLALAATMSPTFNNPVTVLVSPGGYNEINPLIIPANVVVDTFSGPASVIVGFTIPNVDGFVLEGTRSKVKGFSCYSYAVGVTAVHYVGQGTQAQDITVLNAKIGFLIDNADLEGLSTAVNCRVALSSSIPGVSCDIAFSVLNSSYITLYDCLVWGYIGNPIGTAFNVDHSGIDIYSTSVYACANGYVQANDSLSYIENVSFGTCDNTINNYGGVLYITGTQITESTIYDFVIDDVASITHFLGTADSSKFSIVSNANFTASIQDLNPLSSGSRIIGQTISESRMIVGYPDAVVENPQILFDVGEGQAYITDKYGGEVIEYWSYDANASSNSRFTRFTGNAGTQLASNGSSIVVGGKFLWSSLRVDISTIANVGSSSIVAEYWNGTTWTPIGIAAYNRQGMVHHGNKMFQNHEEQFVEHSTSIYNSTWYPDINVLDQIPNWGNTFNMYTVRYRNVGNLVSGMTFSGGKVKGDGYQISANTTQRITAWGRNRLVIQETVIPSQYLQHTIYPADPYSVDISANIKSTVPNCKFTKNKKMAFCDLHYIQPYVDTSTPLLLQIDVVPLSDSDVPAGKINFKAYVVVLERGQLLNGSAAEMVYDITVNSIGIPNLILAGFASIDLSAYPTATAIALTIERDDGNDGDEYMGSVAVPLMIYNHTKKVI